MKLAQTRIVTRDVPALTRFYMALTGMTPTGNDRYIELRAPGLALGISSQHVLDQHIPGATMPEANRSVILDFEVENVDEERLRLTSIVSEFVLEPTTQPWGTRSMLFRDPDGNLINFFTRIQSHDDLQSSASSGLQRILADREDLT
jgi:catechol 2,3-dioxygenase-like lactoylglutathione lyase family enzyme